MVNNNDFKSRLDISQRTAALTVVNMLQRLFKQNEQIIKPWLRGKIDINSYLLLMETFEMLTSKLLSFKQDMGEDKYDEHIYHLIIHNIPQSWLETDLTNIDPRETRDSEDAPCSCYGLVPRSFIELYEIEPPLEGLVFLWTHPTFTYQSQILINYCIQIIVDIINYVKVSAMGRNYYLQHYDYSIDYKHQSGAHWGHDYWFYICRDLYYNMSMWAMLYLWGECIFREISVLLYHVRQDTVVDKDGNHNSDDCDYCDLSWEEASQRYWQKYPWLQQSFDDPLDYFVPGGLNVLTWILFANVPNTAKYQQLLKIRAELKQMYDLSQTYPVKIISEVQLECQQLGDSAIYQFWKLKYNGHTHGAPIDFTFEDCINRNKEFEQEIQIKWQHDQVFQQMCKIYISVFNQPFYLLEKMYHQARDNRSKLLSGKKYPNIDMYKHLFDF